ncbi:hypothetical protein KDA_37530 [Dictyobacter alpinus]|uniref:Pectate lyase superfamily protein domain-containing protein n=1 Tax=Dictyobacter alpinus TaxID=2014873 RepID=A0A402BAC4_9CHLR|nr:glycosyl hydrolase family 28 protein [Dictyobacter alpinus]GCE28269.1 hypothetical protein KDA_37530 [Dictyobacter alpinus]
MGNSRKKLALFVLGLFIAGLLATVAALNVPRLLAPQVHKPTVAPKTTGTLAVTPRQETQKDMLFPYDQTPGAVRSSIKVMVDGQEVFVEKYKDVNYARFAFQGTANIAVTSPDAASYTISPKSYQIHPAVKQNTLTFSIDQPRKLILQANGEKLFIFADAPEENAPAIGDHNVLDVTKYATDRSGNKLQTEQIQQAIDEAAKTQGIVYFPKGKYITGTLTMKSNVSLYLSSGALLSGSGKAQDTHDHFLLFRDVQNVKLYGRGTIDLRGMELRRSGGSEGRVKIIRTINAKDIVLQDLILRDSGSWTVHLVASDGVKINDLKLLNDADNTNNDGIDPDGSRNVTIDGAFIYTTDDCFAIKTSGAFHMIRPTQHILIQNAVCYTKKSALKVGTETKDTLSDITFSHNNVVHADRVIALYMADGNTMENITYSNNWSESVGGNSKQRLIDIAITNRSGIGLIKNVEISNFTAYEASNNPSVIQGMDDHIVNVTFKHLDIAGQLKDNLSAAMIKSSNANIIFTP